MSMEDEEQAQQPEEATTEGVTSVTTTARELPHERSERPPHLRSEAQRGGFLSQLMQIPTAAREKQHVHGQHGAESWRAKILHILHKPMVEYVLMGMLMLDVIILFIELYVTAEFPSCHIIERDAISCCNITTSVDHARFLAEEDQHHNLCQEGSEAEYSPTCDDHKYPGIHVLHTVLRSMTMIVLSIFFFELCLLMVCMGFRKFFSSFFYLFDFSVVSVSLALEISFLALVDPTQLELVMGLLILSRVWRFVRIGHGIFVTTYDLTSLRLHQTEEWVHTLEALLKEKGIELPAKKSFVESLHE